jgi:VCBS repeat-containing protein
VDFRGICAASNPDGYYLIGIPDDFRPLFQEAYTGGARIHSNSWGSDANGDYTIDSANVDDFVWNHRDMAITYSAGNEGIDANGDGLIDNDSTGSPATAKNVITIGASENDRQGDNPCDPALTYITIDNPTQTTCAQQGGQNLYRVYGQAWPDDYPAEPIKSDQAAGNAEQMAAFSSRGPTDDGRIKPDVVAPGTHILSGYADLHQQQYDSTVNLLNQQQHDGWVIPMDSLYKYFGGTSMSNPIAGGAATVLRDFYQTTDGHSASAALVKATLINSAVDLLDENNDGVNDNDFPIPNNHEGWGRIDLVDATDGSHDYVDNTTGIGTGATASQAVTVAAGTPLKVTLVWTDAPSTEAAAINLVNDLDLLVLAPGSATTYRGNVFSGGWSTTGGTADRRNNVENVFIQSPAAGSWTVQVNGFNVPNGPQPFALIIDSAGGPANDPPIAGNDSYGTNEDTVLNVGAPGVLGNDSDPEGAPITAVLATNPSKGNVTLNSNGSFSYTPNANANGADSFTYRANDGSANSAPATVSINIAAVNDPPVGNADSYGTSAGTTLVIGSPGVLGNDTDADGNSLTAVQVAAPTNGSLTLNANGGFSYTPNAGFSGTDSFTYRPNDGTVDGNVTTVTINVASSATMHVGDLDRQSTSQGTRWTALVTITVHNSSHAAVANATVTGNWSNGASGSSSCTTNASGQCTVTKSGIFQFRSSVTFTVSTVTYATMTYASAGNHDPDGDSNGTTIIVPRP